MASSDWTGSTGRTREGARDAGREPTGDDPAVGDVGPTGDTGTYVAGCRDRAREAGGGDPEATWSAQGADCAAPASVVAGIRGTDPNANSGGMLP